MKSEVLIALIGILGTATVAFIGTLFSYLTHKDEHTQFIKRMRAERRFEAYENLLKLVIAAQITQFTKKDGKRINLSTVLMEREHFVVWYPEFQGAWHSKQYLLDLESLKACEALSDFISEVINKYPTFRGGKPNPKSATEEEFFELHARFLPILDLAHKSLKKFLLTGIEKT